MGALGLSVMRERIVLFGPPTAGKSSLSHLAAATRGVAQINAGALLRMHVAADPSLSASLSAGRPVADELLESLIRPRLAGLAGYILEGYPRRLSQLETFAGWPEAKEARFILLDLDLSSVRARFLTRATCPRCRRAEYGRTRCGACGGRLVERADSTPQALEAKLRAYRQNELPLLATLAKAGRLETIAVSGSLEHDLARLDERLRAPPRPGRRGRNQGR